MSEGRWQPMEELRTEMQRLQSEMGRLLERVGLPTSKLGLGGYPLVSVWEDDSAVHVAAEVPGVEPRSLDVSLQGDRQLLIKGERPRPELRGGSWYRQERVFGPFERLVELPAPVDGGSVQATCRDGVLRVTLSKRVEARTRRIPVHVPSSG